MKTKSLGEWRRAPAPLRTSALVGALASALANVPVHADTACLPGLKGLSAQQRSKFTLVQQACGQPAATEPLPAHDEAVADATQLTSSSPVPSSPLITGAPRVADQLTMFDLAEQSRARRPLPPSSTAGRAVQLAPQVDAVAQRHDIDPLLLHAIAYVESRHNSQAVSRAGAMGLMQVMPATGKRFGVSQAGALHQPTVNLEVSATYLKTLQERFGNDLTLILAAYNAGEGAVERYGRRVPPYAETRDYVRKVLEQYEALRRTAERMAHKPRIPT